MNTAPVPAEPPVGTSGQEMVRFYLLGKPDLVRQAWLDLHRQGYIDRFQWTPLVAPQRDKGLVIRPSPGEMFSLARKRLNF